jgi:hypothetical protein
MGKGILGVSFGVGVSLLLAASLVGPGAAALSPRPVPKRSPWRYLEFAAGRWAAGHEDELLGVAEKLRPESVSGTVRPAELSRCRLFPFLYEKERKPDYANREEGFF